MLRTHRCPRRLTFVDICSTRTCSCYHSIAAKDRGTRGAGSQLTSVPQESCRHQGKMSASAWSLVAPQEACSLSNGCPSARPATRTARQSVCMQQSVPRVPSVKQCCGSSIMRRMVEVLTADLWHVHGSKQAATVHGRVADHESGQIPIRCSEVSRSSHRSSNAARCCTHGRGALQQQQPAGATLSGLALDFSVRTREIQRKKSHQKRESNSPYSMHKHRTSTELSARIMPSAGAVGRCFRRAERPLLTQLYSGGACSARCSGSTIDDSSAAPSAVPWWPAGIPAAAPAWLMDRTRIRYPYSGTPKRY